MLIEYLALAARSTPQGVQPTISGLVLSPDSGDCVGSHVLSASIQLNWSTIGTNDAEYEIQISINGSGLVVLGSTATTTYTHTLTGLAAGCGSCLTERTDSFEVRVVRKIDAAVVQSLSAEYTDFYGDCSGGGPL